MQCHCPQPAGRRRPSALTGRSRIAAVGQVRYRERLLGGPSMTRTDTGQGQQWLFALVGGSVATLQLNFAANGGLIWRRRVAGSGISLWRRWGRFHLARGASLLLCVALFPVVAASTSSSVAYWSLLVAGGVVNFCSTGTGRSPRDPAHVRVTRRTTPSPPAVCGGCDRQTTRRSYQWGRELSDLLGRRRAAPRNRPSPALTPA
jgi:hypothetical protein